MSAHVTIPVTIPLARLQELIGSAIVENWAKAHEWSDREALAFTLIEYADGHDTDERHWITQERVVAGLALMARSKKDGGAPEHFEAVLNPRTSDCWTGDAIVQYAIFGRLKYG